MKAGIDGGPCLRRGVTARRLVVLPRVARNSGNCRRGRKAGGVRPELRTCASGGGCENSNAFVIIPEPSTSRFPIWHWHRACTGSNSPPKGQIATGAGRFRGDAIDGMLRRVLTPFVTRSKRCSTPRVPPWPVVPEPPARAIKSRHRRRTASRRFIQTTLVSPIDCAPC